MGLARHFTESICLIRRLGFPETTQPGQSIIHNAGGSVSQTLRGQPDWVCAVAFSSDDRQLVAFGSGDFYGPAVEGGAWGLAAAHPKATRARSLL